MNTKATLRIRLSLGTVLLLACAGCQNPDAKTATDEERPSGPEISAVEAEKLRVDLLHFADQFAASVAGTADEIASRATDQRVLEMTLLWRLRLIPTIQKVSRTEDPRRGFLDMWAVCVQMRHQLERHADTFGEQQHLALETAQRLEATIEAIGAQFVPAAEISKVKTEIEKFAEGYPVSDKFASSMIRASQVTTSGFQKFAGVLSIPISGLSDSATAVDRLARVAAVFTEILQEIPERTRWQTELLLFKVQKLSAINDALHDFGDVSRNFESIAQTTKALPADLRKEFTALVESTDAAQSRLEKTVHEAVEVTANLTRAGVAWDATAKSVNTVMATIKEMEEGSDTASASEDDESFDINEYTRAADAIRSGATEVRSLLEDIESGRLANSVTAVGSTADASIDRAAGRSEELVDRITIRVAISIGLFFAALLVYRWIVRKMS